MESQAKWGMFAKALMGISPERVSRQVKGSRGRTAKSITTRILRAKWGLPIDHPRQGFTSRNGRGEKGRAGGGGGWEVPPGCATPASIDTTEFHPWNCDNGGN